MDLSWANLGSFAGASAVGAGAIGLMLRGWAAGKVVPPKRVEELERRMAELEKIAEAAASHGDLASLNSRLGAVEVSLAGIGATVTAIHKGIAPFERLTMLLVENGLIKERANAG